MTRSAFFFLCMRQNPFVSLVVFGLGFSKSKQDAKHRGRVRAGPSVLWPTKGERNVFPHDTGIKIVDFLQQRHIISSLGLVFSSFFFFPDLTGLITSVLICYWLLLTRTSRWCKSKPVWTCPSFQTYRKKEKKKNNNRKTKITSNSCRALGKIWLKIRSETIIIGWTNSYLNSSGRIQSWFRPQTYLTSRFKCCSVVSIIFQFKSK